MGTIPSRAIKLLDKAVQENLLSGAFFERQKLYACYWDLNLEFGTSSESSFNSLIFYLKAKGVLGTGTSKGYFFNKQKWQELNKNRA